MMLMQNAPPPPRRDATTTMTTTTEMQRHHAPRFPALLAEVVPVRMRGATTTMMMMMGRPLRMWRRYPATRVPQHSGWRCPHQLPAAPAVACVCWPEVKGRFERQLCVRMREASENV
jgi:hypothetical protein